MKMQRPMDVLDLPRLLIYLMLAVQIFQSNTNFKHLKANGLLMIQRIQGLVICNIIWYCQLSLKARKNQFVELIKKGCAYSKAHESKFDLSANITLMWKKNEEVVFVCIIGCFCIILINYKKYCVAC